MPVSRAVGRTHEPCVPTLRLKHKYLLKNYAMAKVKPFKGVRPPKEMVTEVASRPYDVLNSEEARKEAEGNLKSLYHIIKPEIDFEPGTDEHDPKVYVKAA